MKVALRKMGNSHGVIIPKALIVRFGFDIEVELTVTSDGLLLAKPKEGLRSGRADTSKKLAAAGDDVLVWPEFGNDGEETLAW